MFEEIDNGDKSYTMFDDRSKNVDLLLELNKMCMQYKERIIELEDYIDKHRLAEYAIFKRETDFYFTVDCLKNGSDVQSQYTITKGTDYNV